MRMKMNAWKSVLGIAGAALLSSLAGGAVWAQQNEVKVGVIAPISGPWARQGDLMLKGAQLAVDDINAQGGIKSLGGAKLKLMSFDTGDSVEKAKNAAQRMVSEEPDLIGATGSFLSSFTLAVTEVTERAELPFLTFSYSDLLTSRGFKNRARE
jgi:branched-chain amino acid transport system substrate-binding protein